MKKEIPLILRQDHFRFVRLNGKKAIDTSWTTTNNYKHDDPILQEHIQHDNYGVLCGNGLIVLDFDSLEYYEKIRDFLPDTFIVETGSGKYHYYYYCKGVRSTKSIELDIQSDGTQVVAPGSTHPDTGKEYKVVSGPVHIQTLEKQELEEILKRRILDITPRDSSLKISSPIISKYSRFWKKGCRQSLCLALAGVLKKEGFGVVSVKSIIQGLCEITGDMEQSMRLKAVDTTFNRDDCDNSGYKELERLSGIKWLRDDDLLEDQEHSQLVPDQLLMSAQYIVESDIPDVTWYIQGLLTKEGITYIAGTPGDGKSFLALHICECLITGNKFLGQYDCEQCKILYLDEDNRLSTIKNRLGKLELNTPDLFFSVNVGILLNDAGIETVSKMIKKTQVNVVVFDSLVRFVEGEENSSSDMKKLFSGLKILMRRHSISIIVLHHARKNNGREVSLDSLRGSSEFAAQADSVMMLSKLGAGNNSIYEFKTVKSRHDKRFPTSKYKIKDTIKGVSFEFLGESKPVKTLPERCRDDLIAWFNDNDIDEFIKESAKSMMMSKGHTQMAFRRAMETLVEEKIIERIERGKYQVDEKMLLID